MPSTSTSTAPVLGTAALVEELPVTPHAFDRIENLPAARDAIEALTDQVVGMNPHDVKLRLSDIRMDPTGRLCRVSTGSDKRLIPVDPEGTQVAVGGGSNYTSAGLAQCCSFLGKENLPLPRSFPANLYYQPPAIRAFMFNHAVKNSGRAATEPLMFRFLSHPFSNVRILRAVTSEKHTLKNGDTAAIISRLLNRSELLSGSVKASLRYTWDRVSLDFYFPRLVEGVITGPVPFVRIVISETKDSSWSVTSGVFLGNGRIALAAQTTQDLEKTTGRHVGVNVANNIIKGYEFARTLTERTLRAIEAAKAHVLGPGEFAELARTCDFDRADAVLTATAPTTYDVALALMDAAGKTDDESAHRLQLAAARVMQTAVV